MGTDTDTADSYALHYTICSRGPANPITQLDGDNLLCYTLCEIVIRGGIS